MLRSNSNLGFPRKVVVYYLLFSLITISWLALGLLITSHKLMESRLTSASLSHLGKTAATLEMEYLRHGTENLQQALLDDGLTGRALRAYIVSLEGTILAHSDENLIGQSAQEQSGSPLRWGNISGVRYQDELGRTINEFQVPLVAHDDHFGSLRMAVSQIGFWSTLASIVRVAPLIILVPLILIALGGMFLARLVRPVAQVEKQLRTVASKRSGIDAQLEILPAKDAISLGWNRVVELLQREKSKETHGDLKGRLAEIVATREQNGLREVLHNLCDGVAVTDAEGKITFANRAINALLGTEVTNEELAGIELEHEILKATDRPSAEPLFEDASACRTAITEVQRDLGKENRTLRIARLPMQGESQQGHVWSLRDVTQQKITERSRDQFIDAATHELRTPLSNIKAYAETLVISDAIEVEQQKEFCNIINSEVTRLARFVDDLLSISSMEAGSIGIDRQRTISMRLFEEVLDKVQPLMKQKDIHFEMDLPEKMPDLYLDKDKIVAVVVNLLGNAAKYTPEKGRVALRVKLDDSHLHIDVEDSGVGISAEELPRVFEKFFRSSDPRVQEEAGTGLGLPLAKEVVEMHDGEITAESEVDKGTTFMVTIPIR